METVYSQLTEQEMQEVAKQAFYDHCRTFLASQTRGAGDKTQAERIIENIGHEVAVSLVQEQMGEDMGKLIADKAVDVINGLSSFTVFRKPDAWDRESSKGWDYLQKAMDDNKNLIDERVKNIFANCDQSEVTSYLQDVTAEIIERRMFPEVTLCPGK